MTTVIRAHHDADGITTAYFTSHHVKEPKIELWNGEFGDTKGLKEGDWLCDMRPIKDTKGLNVIDHHGPYSLKRSYHLIYDEVPASLIAWREFKDEIPKSEWWKVVIGVTGDGQPELLPFEIFKECPALLTPTKTYAGESYGKWKFSYFPTYKLLSSPINSLLRKHMFDEAIELITEAKQPRDIIKNPKALTAKKDCKDERNKIMASCDIKTFKNLNVVIFYSDYRMSGYIASVVNGATDTTTMCINSRTNRGSLRGDLALYWKERLSGLKYLNIDGHPGFMGASITVNTETLVEDVIKLLG